VCGLAWPIIPTSIRSIPRMDVVSVRENEEEVQAELSIVKSKQRPVVTRACKLITRGGCERHRLRYAFEYAKRNAPQEGYRFTKDNIMERSTDACFTRS